MSAIQLQSTSFWLGVATALSIVFLTSRMSENNSSKQRDKTKRENEIISKRAAALDSESISDEKPIMDSPGLDQRIIRKAEAVIQWRTSRITVVVERCTNDHNYSAILRTAEALGIQNLWIIDPPTRTVVEVNEEEAKLYRNNAGKSTALANVTAEEVRQKAMHHLFAQNANEWLTVREFATTAECVKELRATSHQIWVTDLSQEAVCLTPEGLPCPRRTADNPNQIVLPKVAIVMGTEAVGCSDEMLRSADLRVYLPLRGFADSLNLSVATALVLHQLFLLDPSVIGDMSDSDRRELRQQWFTKLFQQRLLSPSDKKKRSRLLGKIQQCEKVQAKKDANKQLQAGEIAKLEKLEEYKKELEELETKGHLTSNDAVVSKAVQELVDNPPSPLTDVRRADCHRVAFVGKNTKDFHKDHWKNMPATTAFETTTGSSASYFRGKVQSVEEEITS